jgi:hypothetical protein
MAGSAKRHKNRRNAKPDLGFCAKNILNRETRAESFSRLAVTTAKGKKTPDTLKNSRQ